MKVLITFLFLGFCLFGLGSSEKIEPDIKMKNSITYEVTCESTKATQEIRLCKLEKNNDEDEWEKTNQWNRDGKSNKNPSDEYANMVTHHSIVGKACQATLSSDIDLQDHMGMNL